MSVMIGVSVCAGCVGVQCISCQCDTGHSNAAASSVGQEIGPVYHTNCHLGS